MEELKQQAKGIGSQTTKSTDTSEDFVDRVDSIFDNMDSHGIDKSPTIAPSRTITGITG